MKLLYQILINAIAIKLAALYIQGFSFTGDLVALAWTSVLIALANLFLKPVLKLITIPLILLTLGFFTIVVNMAILYVVDYLSPELTIATLQSLFLSTILFGVVNIIFSIFKK